MEEKKMEEKKIKEDDIYEISCEEVQDQFKNHFDKLGDDKALWFKISTHLSKCPKCQEIFLKKIQRTKK